jgi:uncharacterized protein with NAD-binding domain and iron-sulfur cluster
MIRPRAVILGGGMAGLVAAWELSQGRWRDRLESITVYQRGWRLGGKGASSRGSHDRIEEHGLHVLLGYYDATFRVLREAYGELDRPVSDPGCPVRTWRDAFAPAGDVGLADWDGSAWQPFVTRLRTDDHLPGEPGAEDRPLELLDVAARSLRLLWDFHQSTDPGPGAGHVHLSASPAPRPPRGAAATLIRGGGLILLAAGLEALARAAAAADRAGATGLDAGSAADLAALLRQWREGVRAAVAADGAARRTWQLVDLVAANLVGMLTDGLLSGRDYAEIDQLDYRQWLLRHGAADETVDSAIVRGMYDLTFAYEGGDRARPRFAAGLGLQLASRMLFDFKGSIFWRMQAGMGEIVFAPLYEALARRGVRFRFFHRLDRLETDGCDVTAIHLTRQVDLAEGRTDYDPLVRIGGLPCWPDRPLVDQLAAPCADRLEVHGADGPGTGTAVLAAGRDFDVAVLAVSLGMVPHVAADLVAAAPAWRRMVDGVATVGTRAAQLWFDADDAQLGWTGPSGVTLSGFGNRFDTWAAMAHLLPREGWPRDTGPRALAYLCSVLSDVEAAEPDADGKVREALVSFLAEESSVLWPGSRGSDGFRWELLWDDAGRSGAARLQAQYLRANTDPSDRYVQSLPGSGRHRIAPGGTGFANLAVAGDWTDCGLNAGCLEAATRSGVLAARAVLAGAVRPTGGGSAP